MIFVPISDEPIDEYLWASLADVETTKCQEKKMLMPPAEYLYKARQNKNW